MKKILLLLAFFVAIQVVAQNRYIRQDNFKIYNQLPNSWNDTEKIDFGYKNRTDLHNQDGWFSYIKTKTEYQTYGVLEQSNFDYNTMICTHPTIDFTAQEVIDYNENKLNQEVEFEISNNEQTARQTILTIKRRIKREIDLTSYTDNQLDNVSDFIQNISKWLREGEIRRVKRIIANTPRPSGILGPIYDIIKTETDKL